MPRSIIREPSIHKAIKMCQIKENEGFHCIRKLQRTYSYYKHFQRAGGRFDYLNTDQQSYWEAVYEKDVRR